MRDMKKIALLLIVPLLSWSLSACAGNATPDSGDPEYEAEVIQIEGINELEGAIAEMSVSELRALEQQDLDAHFQRTTGMYEDFHMQGPTVADVIAYFGGDLADYAAIGVIGRDGYYCLYSREVIDTTELLLAVTIDGQAQLDEDNWPARLAAQGQFGPYWVREVARIILYQDIPEKEITSVWVFHNLIAGIEPYAYEYYGSQDQAIELSQIFSRFDYVDSSAFFTMKSSDGFTKNEAITMVNQRYYIKYTGVDAPTNVSPEIKLGMNVQRIAWFSTNADAVVFPEVLAAYLENVTINGETGVALSEALYEAGVATVKGAYFELIGADGEKIIVPGAQMSTGILVANADGGARVVWPEGSGYENIANLLRIRVTESAAPDGQPADGEAAEDAGGSGNSASNGNNAAVSGADAAYGAYASADKDGVVFSIQGDGVAQALYFTLEELKSFSQGYTEQKYSTRNNYPTLKFAVGQGVGVGYLLDLAGLKDNAALFTFTAADGYAASFTRSQLLGAQYYYPYIQDQSAGEASLVSPLLAWAYAEGTSSPAAAAEIDGLRLLVGQNGINEVNTAVSVQDATRLTVSTAAPGSWEAPAFSTNEQNQVVISHPALDSVKIYYTTDGSAPTVASAVYNPSTTYFQPQLIKPLSVASGTTVKAIAAGYGKEASSIAEFTYTAE